MLGAWAGALGTRIPESGTLGLQGLMNSRIQGQQVSGSIRLEWFQSREIRSGGARVLKHLRSVSDRKGPRSWGQGQSQCCVGLSPEFGRSVAPWGLGSSAPKACWVSLGLGDKESEVHCHEHPISGELGSQPLEDWGSVGTKQPKIPGHSGA